MEQNTSLTDKTLEGFFWMFSGKGSQAILQFVVMVVLARLLSPSDFGIVNAAMVVVTFTTVFSMIGVGPALTRRPVLDRSHIQTGFTITLCLSVVFALLLYAGSPVIAGFFHVAELETVLQVMSVIFLLKGVSTVAESLVQRKMRFRLFAGIEIAAYALYGSIGIVSAVMGAGYWALVFGQIGQNLVKAILLVTLERHSMKPQLHWASVKELLFFAGGYTMGRLSNQAALQADNLVVGRTLGLDALGLYSRAYQLMVMPTNLFGRVMDKVLFPAMAHIQKKPKQLSQAYRMGITAVALLTIPAGVLICFLSEDIVRLLFGDQWLELVPALRVLALGLVFRTGYKISESLARATGAVYRRAWRQIIYALAVLTGAWTGQHWGIVGVAVGVLGAIILNYGLMMHLSMHFLHLSFRDIVKSHLPGFFLGIVAGLTVLFVDGLSAMIAVPSVLRILLSGVLFLSFVAVLVKLNALRFFGKDVLWIKDQLLDRVKKKREA